MAFEAAVAAAAEDKPVVADLPEKVPGRKVHIDGDGFAYYYGVIADVSEAKEAAASSIRRSMDLTGAEEAVVHITSRVSSKGDRFLAATTKPYQGNRSGSTKPTNYAYLHQWLADLKRDRVRGKVWTTREADDGIAACSAYAALTGGLEGIDTQDKDMRMLPGLHIAVGDSGQEVVKVNPEDYCVVGPKGKVYGHKWFWLQMLQGDSADNIPGLELGHVRVVEGRPERYMRIGPKSAEKMLSGTTCTEEACEVVLEAYARGYAGRGVTFYADRFVEQASLLWLRRGVSGELLDFLTYDGPGAFGLLLPGEVVEAANNLASRVEVARAMLNELRSS